ncbi:MAG: acyl-CoA dehydratase activase [Pseudomonadota bacterium]
MRGKGIRRMRVAGVDIGSRSGKAVIMEDGEIISSSICDTILKSGEIARLTIEGALEKAGLTLGDIQYTIATGYGRFVVPYASGVISEISCHGKGIHYYFPSVRTILDIGGQDSKVIRINERGRVIDFIMNDKCAGGTGRFLEMIADVLQVPGEEVERLHFQSRKRLPFSSICVVFVKSEVLTMLREGEEKSDIIAGLNDSVATAGFGLLKKTSIKKDLSITGGVAKNAGVVERIREKTGLDPLLAPDPQIVGALGAAVFARERLLAGQKKGA